MLTQLVCLADYFVTHFKVPGSLCSCVQVNVQQGAAVNVKAVRGSVVSLGHRLRLRGRISLIVDAWHMVMDPIPPISLVTRLGWSTGILAHSGT